MRRKPEFDRFTVGLSKRVALWIADEDATAQDLTNLCRSELSRVWIYLIKKINKLEHESEDKDQTIQQLEDALRDTGEALEFYANRFSWEWSEHPSLEMYSGEIRNDSSLVKYKEVDGEEYQNHCGGKRARETLQKHSELLAKINNPLNDTK
jgi:hypothetical protein